MLWEDCSFSSCSAEEGVAEAVTVTTAVMGAMMIIRWRIIKIAEVHAAAAEGFPPVAPLRSIKVSNIFR